MITNLLKAAGILILSGFALFFHGRTFLESWSITYLFGIILAFLLLGFLFELFQEIKSIVQSREIKFEFSRHILQGIALIVGALAAYVISVDFKLGAVLASAAVGFLAGIIFPRFAVAAYCGSFVGMTSSLVFSQYWQVAVAALFSVLVYILVMNIFTGFGGKLGTIAFVGSITAMSIFQCSFVNTPQQELSAGLIILSILLSVLSLLLTFWISVNLKKGPVIGSSLVSLFGVAALALFGAPQAGMLGTLIMAASFSGMVGSNRLKSLASLSLAGLFTGVVFLSSLCMFCGAGGKLGTIAFGSILGARGIERLWHRAAGVLYKFSKKSSGK